MSATRVGVIAEGQIDHALLCPLLEKIAEERAHYGWPVLPEDAAEFLQMRKRGFGGVLKCVERLVRLMRTGMAGSGYAFFVIVLDHRKTETVRNKLHRLLQRAQGVVSGEAVEEIEAWWLADRKCVLAWLGLAEKDVAGTRYAAGSYDPESDQTPKRTLDELTRMSKRIGSEYGRGSAYLAEEFADRWRTEACLGDIERQCPQGFRPFSSGVAAAFRQARLRSGRLY